MNILVSVPNTGYIHKFVAGTLLKIIKDSRYNVRIIMPTHVPAEVNYNNIAKDFWEGDFDYWLTMDSDNPPFNNPLDLIQYGRDIIGLPTPVYNNKDSSKTKERPVYLNAYKWNEKKQGYNEWPDKEGLQEVDAIGSGCMLIQKRVFADKEMRKKPFKISMDEHGGLAMGSDIRFCKKAKERGFKVYAHFDYLCRHFNELEIHEVTKDFMRMKNG